MRAQDLFAALQDFFTQRSREIKEKFHRVLPFGELVVDRWAKARMLGFGEGANIYDSAIVLGDVFVGKQTWVGPHVILDGAAAAVRIGDFCSISAGVHIYTHNSVAWALSGGEFAYPSAAVTIGDRVYIGPHSVIAKGVTIGSGCVIGAHSLVTKDIPSGFAAWGQPAQIKGKVILDEQTQSYRIEQIGEPTR